MAIAPLNKVARVLDYATSRIEPQKIWLGTPNYGYDFILPYEPGTSAATSLSNEAAITKAFEVGANIEYDEESEAPYYRYFDSEKKEHVVWFEDARSVNATLNLIQEQDITTFSIWTVMKYFPQLWQVVIGRYKIKEADLENPLENFR